MDDEDYSGGDAVEAGDYTDDQSYLDALNASNSSGNSAYADPDTLGATSGAVINSSSSPLSAPYDASGGSGSYLSTLQDTLTSGLSSAVIDAGEFGLGSLIDRITVGPSGTVTPAAAPTPQSGASALLSNPLVWVGIIAVVLIVASHK